MSQTIRGPAAGPSLIGVGAVAAAAAVLRASQPVLSGVDSFWHWDIGRRILEQGLIRDDPYSFLTTGREWILNQWGTELVIGLARAAGGIWLVAVMTSLLIGGAMLLVGWVMWRRSPSLLSLALLVLVVASTVTNWSLRGNLFTFLLLPLLLLELRRGEGPRWWAVLLLLTVWANLHAAFVVGVAFVFLDRVGHLVVSPDRSLQWRSFTILMGAALLAGTMTPYGPRYLIRVLQLSTQGAAGTGITEWQPTPLTRPHTLTFTLLIVLVLVSVAMTATEEDLPDILLTVAGALLGVSAMRNVAAGAITVGIVGAPYLRRAYVVLRARPARDVGQGASTIDRVLFISIATLGVAGALATVPQSSRLEDHVSGVPLDLIQQLDALDRPVRVVTVSRWAPAVAALTGDHVTISVDGRLELFTADEYDALRIVESADTGWEDILDEWCVDHAVLPADHEMTERLSKRASWRSFGEREGEAGGWTRRLPASC